MTTSHHISLEPFCKAHLARLAVVLRRADRLELQAAYGLPVREGLRLCRARSAVSVAFLYQGEVCAAAGVEPESLLGRRACVWSWTGKGVERCPKSFWKASKAVLGHFQRLYPELYAACDERYGAARRYLERLGAREEGKRFYLTSRETRFCLYRFERSLTTEIY